MAVSDRIQRGDFSEVCSLFSWQYSIFFCAQKDLKQSDAKGGEVILASPVRLYKQYPQTINFDKEKLKMSNMQIFYKKIKTTKSEPSMPYLSSLEKLTHLDLTQVQSVVTDLWWNDWYSPSSQVSETM
jgi:hypothetical protein